MVKLGHECFKLNQLDVCQCILEAALALTLADNDTAYRLKMTALSTLSACYWRQNKFDTSMYTMNLELNLISNLARLNSNSKLSQFILE